MTTVAEIEQYRALQRENMEKRKEARLTKQKKKLYVQAEMARLHNVEGLSYAVIGRMYRVSRQRVHQLLSEFVADMKDDTTEEEAEAIGTAETTTT